MRSYMQTDRSSVNRYKNILTSKQLLIFIAVSLVGISLILLSGLTFTGYTEGSETEISDSLETVEESVSFGESPYAFSSNELETQDESDYKVFSGSFDDTIRAVDAGTGEEEWSFTGHSDTTYAVSASADGETVYSGSDDETLRAIDTETGEEIWSFTGHFNRVTGVSSSPDGEKVYSSSNDETVRAIDAETGEQIWRYDGFSDRMNGVSVSPDSETVYVGSDDNTLRALDAETGDEIWTSNEHSGNVQDVAVSPDGEKVYSGSSDETLKAIDAETGEEIWSFGGHTFSVNAVSVSPDGEKVFSGANGNNVRAVDAETGEQIWSFGGHGSSVFGVSASPDGEKVYSGAEDNNVRALDAETGDEIWSYSGHSGTILDVSAPSGVGVESEPETGIVEDTTTDQWNISIEGFEGSYDVSNPFISYGVEVTYNGDESTTADINYILESKGLGFVDITQGSQSFSPGETKEFTEQSPNGLYRAAQESKYYGDGELPQVLNLTTDISGDGEQLNSRSLENNDDIDNFWSPFSVEEFSSEPDSIDITDEIEYSVSLQNQFQDDYEDTITVELVDSQDFDRVFYRNEVTEETDDGEYITFSDEFFPELDVVNSIPQDVTLRLITDDSNIERQNDINVEVEPGDIDIQSLDVPPEVESGDVDINWSVINDEQVQKDENITVEILDTNTDEIVYDETETYTIEGSSVLQETTTVNLSEGEYKVTLSTETDSRDRDFSVVDEVDIGEPDPQPGDGETEMGIDDWVVPDSVNWGGSFEYELVLSQFGDGEESITDDVTVDVTSGGEVIYSTTLEEVTIEEGDTFTFGESFIHEADIEEIPQEGNFFVSFEESSATLDIDYAVIDFTDPVTQLVWDDVNIPETAEVGEEYDFSATLRNPAVSNTIAENYSVVVENSETVYDQSGSVELQPGEDTSISGQVVFDSVGEYTVTFESDNRVEKGDVEVVSESIELTDFTVSDSIEVNESLTADFDIFNPTEEKVNETITFSVEDSEGNTVFENTSSYSFGSESTTTISFGDDVTGELEEVGNYTWRFESNTIEETGEFTVNPVSTERTLANVQQLDGMDRVITMFTDLGIIALFLITGASAIASSQFKNKFYGVVIFITLLLALWAYGSITALFTGTQADFALPTYLLLSVFPAAIIIWENYSSEGNQEITVNMNDGFNGKM